MLKLTFETVKGTENQSNYYDQELADALIEIWRIRNLMSKEQREKLLALPKEKFV